MLVVEFPAAPRRFFSSRRYEFRRRKRGNLSQLPQRCKMPRRPMPSTTSGWLEFYTYLIEA
jgi:hypothetical protein